MIELVVGELLWPIVAGVGMGVFYFGLLWLTVARLPEAPRPGLLLLVSSIGRLAIVLVGFYRVAAGRGDRLLACLAGFVVARVVMVWRVQPAAVRGRTTRPGSPTGPGKGGGAPASDA